MLNPICRFNSLPSSLWYWLDYYVAPVSCLLYESSVCLLCNATQLFFKLNKVFELEESGEVHLECYGKHCSAPVGILPLSRNAVINTARTWHRCAQRNLQVTEWCIKPRRVRIYSTGNCVVLCFLSTVVRWGNQCAYLCANQSHSSCNAVHVSCQHLQHDRSCPHQQGDKLQSPSESYKRHCVCFPSLTEYSGI